MIYDNASEAFVLNNTLLASMHEEFQNMPVCLKLLDFILQQLLLCFLLNRNRLSSCLVSHSTVAASAVVVLPSNVSASMLGVAAAPSLIRSGFYSFSGELFSVIG